MKDLLKVGPAGQKRPAWFTGTSSASRPYWTTTYELAAWPRSGPVVEFHPRLTPDFTQQARQFTYLAEELVRRFIEGLSTLEQDYSTSDVFAGLAPKQTEKVIANVTYVTPRLRVFYEPLPD